MKTLKKVFITILCVIMAATVFGCGRKVENSETDIQIMYWKAGFGIEFLNKIANSFTEKYPQYNVIIDDNPNQSAITQTFGLGAEYDTVDLYMYSPKVIDPMHIATYAEPLDDILEAKVDGEETIIKDKFKDELLESMIFPDGSYHMLSYGGGWASIVYNKKYVSEEEVPKTTDELYRLTMDLKAAYARDEGPAPYMNFSGGGYWFTIYEVWQAQYRGLDYHLNTFQPLDASGKGENDNPSKEVLLTEDGRKAAIEVVAQILDPETIDNGSNDNDFTTSQTRFLNEMAVMMPNGTWLMNEMGNIGNSDDYAMMKVPVISSIVQTFTDPEDREMRDSTLSSIIDEIDDGAETSSLCEQSTFDRIKEARNLMYSNYNDSVFIVPNYAVAKQGAKEFIKYFYSDEAIKIFAETTHLEPPVNLDGGSLVNTENWTAWERQQQTFSINATPVYDRRMNVSPLFTRGGAHAYAAVDFVTAFSSRDNTETIDSIWKKITQTLDSNWSNYLTTAGFDGQ